MEILIKAAQLILSLSIIVTLHEMGHFFPARWFGIRVEKFFLFFDAWGKALYRKTVGETTYGIGWLPLGGYVKIAGMIDESMDKEQMAKPPQPDEFRSKPTWQRLIVMVGGVVVNLILGLLIYIFVLFTWGEEYVKLQDMQYGLHVIDAMEEFGFQEGDIITSVQGVGPVETMNEVNLALLLDDPTAISIMRDGSAVDIPLPEGISDTLLELGSRSIFAMREPMVVDSIIADGGASKSQMQLGDVITGIDGTDVVYFGDCIKALQSKKGKTVSVRAERNGQELTYPVDVSEKGQMGIDRPHFRDQFDETRLTYSFSEAIPAGINLGIKTLVNYTRSLKLMLKSAGIKQVGGFATIGNLFSPTWDWQVFWSMTAFISIILGIMNILPIPALDGGHVVFLLWEMVSGKPAPQRVLEAAQLVGFILVIALVLYANGNDAFKAWFK